MDGRFSSRILNDLGQSFRRYKLVENMFDFFQGEVIARPRVGEAQGTIHIAGTVYFDNTDTGVLLVVRAKTAVMGTSMHDLSAMVKGNGARFIKLG
jgi:hypothetical protein